jgi:hypothetical protein
LIFIIIFLDICDSKDLENMSITSKYYWNIIKKYHMWYKFELENIEKINQIYHHNIRITIEFTNYKKNINIINNIKKTYNLRLKFLFDTLEPIRQGDIPNITSHLMFPNGYNEEIEPNMLPNSIIFMYMGMAYDKPIKKGVFPNSLKYLVFQFEYNQEFEEGSLPPNLTHLRLSSRYNQRIKKNILPDSLLYLFIPNKKLLECDKPQFCKIT